MLINLCKNLWNKAFPKVLTARELRKQTIDFLIQAADESDTPYVMYKGQKCYTDMTFIGYLPVFITIPERKMVLLYNADGTDYERLILPDYFKHNKETNYPNKFSFKIMDYFKYGNLDITILDFFIFDILDKDNVVYSKCLYKNDNKFTPSEFIDIWGSQNFLRADQLEPYVVSNKFE